jgi:hypothetical protein
VTSETELKLAAKSKGRSDGICLTLPEDALCGPFIVGTTTQCLIRIKAAVLDRLRALRQRESYSDVILRLVELEGAPARLRPIGRSGPLCGLPRR